MAGGWERFVGGANRARRGGMGRGADSPSTVGHLDVCGLMSPRSADTFMDMTRDGVKTLLADMGSGFWGDSTKPA